MKKYIGYLLIVAMILTSMPIRLQATGNNIESIRAKLNSDMQVIYGKADYYKLEGLHIDVKDQIRGAGEQLSNIPSYGGPYGRKDQGEWEFLGKSPLGDDVPNPQYGWDVGWDGKRIADWGILEPWGKWYCSQNAYDNGKSFNVPGIGATTLEASIQQGVDLVYGNKTYKEIKGSGAPNYAASKNNSKVHVLGEHPDEGWVKYVHIITPPTDKTWGQGRIYQPGGYYMGVPIAPFELLGPDLEVEMAPSSFSKPFHLEDQVSVSATIYSTYENEEETTYQWIIKGTASHKDYTSTATFSGYSGEAKNIGTVIIPSSQKGDADNNPAVLDITFQMPDEEVEVFLTVNKQGTKPEEMMLANNKASVVVPWEPYTITKASYYLNYNELSKEFRHEIGGGSVSGSVDLPKGWWKEGSDGELEDTTGSLNVSTVKNDNALLDISYSNNKQGDTSLSVSEPSSSVTKNPILTATMDRSSFGDNPPSKIFKTWSNPKQADIRAFQSKYAGSLSKPYEWEESRTGTRTGGDGKPETYTYYVTLSGTATGRFFPEGTDILSIGVYIYNGMKKMPHVAERDFKKEIDDNDTDSLNKTVWWESDPYEMNVQRFMSRTYLIPQSSEGDEEDEEKSGPIDMTTEVKWEAVDGQYTRTFTGQNKAQISWDVQETMQQAYHQDRLNAKNKKRGKSDYEKVPFATDRELQSYTYPFKSGYFFNPAGTYTFTVSTEIYKDKDEATEEHQKLIEELINSFRYNSTMQYQIDGSTEKLLLKAESTSSELEKYLSIPESDYETNYESERLEYSSIPGYDDKTDIRFKQILEGYSESNTESSKDEYLYKEYIKEGDIYLIKETTKVTIYVNPENYMLYTYGGMKNGEYYVTSWAEDIDLESITKVAGMVLKGIKDGGYIDHIPVQVQGSMYDDLNN